ncbi:MAG TPA: serine hydrolase domain-containing protein, partial [Trueperaceae bacterium]|nr:serine hydrolase domain-containing protein [Trueperaceae bacterium]
SILLPVAPAGAHWSTANDMARYALTLLRGGVTPDGERVVSAENLAVTWEPQVPVASGVDYGLGWFVAESQGLGLVFHGGNTFGFTSELTLVPDLDLGLVVLTNAQGANAFTQLVGQRLIELLFDRPDETTALLEYSAEQLGTALADLAARTLDEVDMAAVEAFLGSYANPHLGTVTLRHEGGRLVLDAGEFQAELRPHLDRRGEPAGYVMVDGPLASLPVRLGAGEAGDGIAIGEGALTYAFEPID